MKCVSDRPKFTCEGEVKMRSLFCGQLHVPLCEIHYLEIAMIQMAKDIGVDTEKVKAELDNGPDWMKKCPL